MYFMCTCTRQLPKMADFTSGIGLCFGLLYNVYSITVRSSYVYVRAVIVLKNIGDSKAPGAYVLVHMKNIVTSWSNDYRLGGRPYMYVIVNRARVMLRLAGSSGCLVNGLWYAGLYSVRMATNRLTAQCPSTSELVVVNFRCSSCNVS